jgi:glycosyltransferase involved in cell wall biosynthesis
MFLNGTEAGSRPFPDRATMRRPKSPNAPANGDEANVTISVVLCTYNRCQTLTKALQSLAASDMPDTVVWEIVVVDNNSHDQTREVVEGFGRNCPGRFRYVFEGQQGKSYALNTGIREAHGRILAFVDDDATPEPTWLRSLTRALATGDWAGAGGRILPEPGFLPPPWLPLEGPRSMGGVLAFFDQGDDPGQLGLPPYGTNMCFRREMFERYGGFRTDLGPRPGSQIRNEDTEFGRRLMAAGERLWYEPSAIVYHPVPESRLRKKYFLTWWFDDGRARVREIGRRPAVCGIPRHYLRIPRLILFHLPKLALQWMLAFDSQQRFISKCWVWTTFGEIAEMFRLGTYARPNQNSRVQTDSHVPGRF